MFNTNTGTLPEGKSGHHHRCVQRDLVGCWDWMGLVKACLRSEPADANTESCEYLGGQDMGHAISKGPNAVGLGPVTVPEHHCIFPWRPGSDTERACKSPTH